MEEEESLHKAKKRPVVSRTNPEPVPLRRVPKVTNPSGRSPFPYVSVFMGAVIALTTLYFLYGTKSVKHSLSVSGYDEHASSSVSASEHGDLKSIIGKTLAKSNVDPLLVSGVSRKLADTVEMFNCELKLLRQICEDIAKTLHLPALYLDGKAGEDFKRQLVDQHRNPSPECPTRVIIIDGNGLTESNRNTLEGAFDDRDGSDLYQTSHTIFFLLEKKPDNIPDGKEQVEQLKKYKLDESLWTGRFFQRLRTILIIE